MGVNRIGKVTTSPTAEWTARQITEAFPWYEVPRYIIRDRDCTYGRLYAWMISGSRPGDRFLENGTGVSAIGSVAYMSGERCRSLRFLTDRGRGIARGFRAGVCLADPRVPMQTSNVGNAMRFLLTHFFIVSERRAPVQARW